MNQPENLEDQVRRMIINNGPPKPGSGDQAQQRPVVRLPGLNGAPTRHRQPQHSTVEQLPSSIAHEGLRSSVEGLTWRQRESLPVRQPQQHSAEHAAQHRMQQPHRHAQYAAGREAHGYSADGQQRYRRQLYDPNQQQSTRWPWQQIQARYLDEIAAQQLELVNMSTEERSEKLKFRAQLEQICQDICQAKSDKLPPVELKCFGSFESGFATANSDMDLVIVVTNGAQSSAFSLHEDDLPRLLERRLLQLGYGARLLTRTRVPIIKVCEQPSTPLLSALRAERVKWDMRDNDAKYGRRADEEGEEDDAQVEEEPATIPATDGDASPGDPSANVEAPQEHDDPIEANIADETTDSLHAVDVNDTTPQAEAQDANTTDQQAPKRNNRQWTRHRDAGPLDFPKSGVGVQCDINFFNPLGLHNTQMLRCYSLCDQRVRQIVLFVKAWAKRRMINSAYSGTLSSYGYVLMVLHYLVNIARPPVLPNLQQSWRPVREYVPPGTDRTEIDGWLVDFWCREHEIQHAAANNLLTRNTDTVGALLAGFFQYFAATGEKPFYHWTQNTLSLRNLGGIISKEEKGWVKSRTEEGDGKKVQYRYLFCIEDPFELDHNVARTVTHYGIVAMRDEFRRAARILNAVGNQLIPHDGSLFDEVSETVLTEPMTLRPKPGRKPRQQAEQGFTPEPMKQQFDVLNKDAFPDLSLRQGKGNKQNTKPQHHAKQQPKSLPAEAGASADVSNNTDKAQPPDAEIPAKEPTRRNRRTRRRPVKIDEL